MLLATVYCNVREQVVEMYQVKSSYTIQNYINDNYLELCKKWGINFRAITNIEHIPFLYGGEIVGTYNNEQITLFEYRTKNFSDIPTLD